LKSYEPFERRIEIIKLLHGQKMRTGELAEHFGVDDRTIRADIDSLRMGIDILGVKIKIESKHEGSQKHYYISTVHPIMLALNLSELFALLKLLENASSKNGGEVYKSIFQGIYSQMTDYAESRISGLLENKYDKSEIINNLEENAFNKHKDYKLIFWLKSGEFIEISYLDEDNKPFNEKVKLLDFDGDMLKVVGEDGKQRLLDYNDIVIDWSEVEYK
jgi:predicted ArsR family transcriptional regulator